MRKIVILSKKEMKVIKGGTDTFHPDPEVPPEGAGLLVPVVANSNP